MSPHIASLSFMTDITPSLVFQNVRLLSPCRGMYPDHVGGLSAKSFGQVIVCSIDAKEMPLRHETYLARYLNEGEFQVETIKTFKHLKTDDFALNEQRTRVPGTWDLLASTPPQFS